MKCGSRCAAAAAAVADSPPVSAGERQHQQAFITFAPISVRDDLKFVDTLSQL